jgi:hypothetical protein
MSMTVLTKSVRRLAFVITGLMVMAMTANGGVAAAASRVALVMAVEDYTPLAKSPLSVNAARLVVNGLTKQGFDVAFSANPSNAVARAAIRDFAGKANGADGAIIILVGHGATAGGLSYFLPANTLIERETDLFSRAIAMPSLAQIVSKAKAGALLFVMSVPNIPSTLQGISARPVFSGPVEKNTVIAFSTSDKVPVSRIDAVSQQALADLGDVAREVGLKIPTLIAAATAGGIGRTFGDATDADWGRSGAGSGQGQGDAELRAAQERARAAEERARRAEAMVLQERLQAANVGKPPQPAPNAAPQPAPSNQVNVTEGTDDVAALQVVEAMLGVAQRRSIQVKLKQLRLYNGPIDGLFLELTRQAIKDYQRSRGERDTGFLTPAQLQILTRK